MSRTVRQEQQGRVRILTLDRPDAMNALNAALIGELAGQLRVAAADEGVGAVVITGAPPAFSAGADLKEVRGLLEDPALRFRPLLHQWRSAFRQIEELPKPVIAAVNGTTLAGGLELMLACDVAIAAASARLGDGHIRYGLVPGGGGSQRLPVAIGTRAARWLMYTGDLLSADRALDLGLVVDVLPDDAFVERVVDRVQPIAQGSAPALALMKRMTTPRLVTADGLELEVEATVSVIAGPEAREGIAAFAEGRRPVFRPEAVDA